MSDTKAYQYHSHCAVKGCTTSIFNKTPYITLFPFPENPELRNKWAAVLRNRCPNLIWNKSKICSKHFENKCFDSSRRLKENSVPSMFPAQGQSSSQRFVSTKINDMPPRARVDRLLNKLTQSELVADIKDTMSLIKVPYNFSDCVTDDLQCVVDTPVEAQLWLLIKKQDHLVTRLMQLVTQNKKHVEVLQNNLEDARASKKAIESNVETMKYIVKSLQEKNATLEEQVEILSAVESR